MCTGLELLFGGLSAAAAVVPALMQPKAPEPPPLPAKQPSVPVNEDPQVHIGQNDPTDNTQENYAGDTFAPTRKAAQTTGTNLGRSGLSL